jgi:hypothetical protein
VLERGLPTTLDEAVRFFDLYFLRKIKELLPYFALEERFHSVAVSNTA